MSLLVGKSIEQRIAKFLIKQGLSLRTCNYRCRWGEIDLIMQHDNYLVFVEVRARSSASHGGALASITAAKRARLTKTAHHYLSVHGLTEQHPARFDVVCVDGHSMQWIKNAFDSN